MTHKLNFDRKTVDGWEVVRLDGDLVEGLGQLLAPLATSAGTSCVFDLEKIAHVNSSGMAEWVEFMDKFCRNRSVALQSCAPVVVDTMNLMPLFIGKAVVRSVLMLFRCGNCDFNPIYRIDLGPSFVPTQAAGPRLCPKCAHKTLEPDTDVEDYFSFVNP